MKIKNSYCLVAATTIALLIGCSNPHEKAINQMCVGLEKIEDNKQRSEQYMQCRKACGDAQIYNMPEGKDKQRLIDICVGAGETGDNKFKKSTARNWLGVMP